MYDKEIVIGGEISLNMLIDGDTDLSLVEDGIEGTVIAYEQHGHETYTGDYTVTPSKEEQVLETKSKLMRENVIIEPIPSNYGLITWNGSVLTVS